MALPSLTTTINPFPSGRDKTQKWQMYKGQIAIGSGGLYATNGLPFALSGAAVLTSTPIDWMEMYSLTTGFIYKWDPVNRTIRIFSPSVATGTVDSTSSAPTITTSSGGVSTALGVAAGALSEVAGASGITGVQAPTITSTFTGTGGGAATELTNGASVTADTLYFRAECVSN